MRLLRTPLFFFAFSALLGIGQSSYPDSMRVVLENSTTESEKAQTLVLLSNYYKGRDIDTSLFFAEQALGHAKKSGIDLDIANALNALGNVYNVQGKLGTSLPIFLEALQYATRANDKNKIARINNNIGIVYYYQGDKEKALDHFQTTANMLISQGDTLGAVFAFNNIAGIYNDLNKDAEALAYFERGYNLAVLAKSTWSESVLLTGIATMHAKMKEYGPALDEHLEALEMKREMNNIGSIVHSLDAIADIYLFMDKPHKAIPYLKEMRDLSIEAGVAEKEKDAHMKLSRAYVQLGDYKNAWTQLDLQKKIESRLDSIAQAESITSMQAKYDKAQDEKKIAQLEKTELSRQAEIERKEFWNILLVGGGTLVLILALLIYSRLRTSRKQTKIIKEQKQLVDEKNKEVLDSITYAQRIQQAMLKSEVSQTGDRFEHFVLFKPKDIVSGDFYWVEEKKDSLYVGAVDCTGHGVPGAFLTLLGTAFLNEIVAVEEELAPAEILNQLRSRIINELGQAEEGGGKDGMDMSLLKLAKDGKSAEWAGANNPLWLLRKGVQEIEEIKADKEHIGYSYQMTPFTNHEVNLGQGDALYLFSDGYADQFGGLNQGHAKEKKFKTKQLKQLIVDNAQLGMQDQMKAYDEALISWMGDIEQLDDICLIGLRI